MPTADVRNRLVDADRRRTVRCLLVAAGVLVAGLGLLYWRWAATPRGIGWSVQRVDLVWIVAVVSVGLAVVPGYRDDGLLAGWALGTAPFVARALGPAVVPAKAFDEPVLLGLATGMLLGIVAGTVGFVIGVGVRRVRDVGESPGVSSP